MAWYIKLGDDQHCLHIYIANGLPIRGHKDVKELEPESNSNSNSAPRLDRGDHAGTNIGV